MRIWGGGSKGAAPLLLTSTLDGGEWSASRHGRSTSGIDLPYALGRSVCVWAPEADWTLLRK
jgi:hypothetical protein